MLSDQDYEFLEAIHELDEENKNIVIAYIQNKITKPVERSETVHACKECSLQRERVALLKEKIMGVDEKRDKNERSKKN